MCMKDEKPLSDKSDKPLLVLTIYTLFGMKETKLETPPEKDSSYLSLLNGYLSKNRMYVARATASDIAIMDLIGDLYIER